MSFDIKTFQVMEKTAFAEAISSWSLSVKKVWDNASVVFLDAVVHYHRNSYDTSRPLAFLKAAEEAGAGAVVTCCKYVLNNATGINIANGTHSATKLGRNEDWESILATLQAQGLRAFQKSRETAAKKDSEKAKTFKLKPGVNEELADFLASIVNDANEAAEDEHAQDNILTLLKRKAGTMPDAFEGIPDKVAAELRRGIANCKELATHTETVTTKAGNATFEENGIDKALRAATGFVERTTFFLTDFAQSVEDLKGAAQAEAANDAEAA